MPLGLMVREKLAHRGSETTGVALLGASTLAALARFVLVDHVDAAGALAVNLVSQLARLAQREGAAKRRLVRRLGVREIDASQCQLGRAAGAAKAHCPGLCAGRLGLNHQVEAGRLAIRNLAPLGLRGVLCDRGSGEYRHYG